jgi:hypothetical protein
MFMPAPWITRTLVIALSVRTGMVDILRRLGRSRLTGLIDFDRISGL